MLSTILLNTVIMVIITDLYSTIAPPKRNKSFQVFAKMRQRKAKKKGKSRLQAAYSRKINQQQPGLCSRQ